MVSESDMKSPATGVKRSLYIPVSSSLLLNEGWKYECEKKVGFTRRWSNGYLVTALRSSRVRLVQCTLVTAAYCFFSLAGRAIVFLMCWTSRASPEVGLLLWRHSPYD